jgi:hypothetical protein
MATQPFRNVSSDNEFYIPIATLVGKIFALNTTTNTLSTAAWVGNGGAGDGSRFTSSINAAGAGLLRDTGRTFTSAGRSFRKVQLVVPQSTGTVSTFGVNGKTGTTPFEDYLTGFIETGFDLAAGTTPTPVAKWGR